MILRLGENSYYVAFHDAVISAFYLVIATMFKLRITDEEREKKYGEKIKAEYIY